MALPVAHSAVALGATRTNDWMVCAFVCLLEVVLFPALWLATRRIRDLARRIFNGELARISHTVTTAAAKSLALTALRSVTLLDVLYSTSAGASVARLVMTALSPPRNETV